MTQDFGGNVQKIEMSRYIDLDIYHAVERSHPFYIEMTNRLLQVVDDTFPGKEPRRLLELGAGTGLATVEFAKLGYLSIDALEYDQECCQVLEGYAGAKARVICGDAIVWRGDAPYDLVASVFAHDHIHYDRRFEFARNIRANLQPGGLYLMGGEILPTFDSDEEHREALYKYHGFIVETALRASHFEVAQIEINALKSGLYRIGDFKRHEAMFEEEMLSAGFAMTIKERIGPQHRDDVGGVYVYAFTAI
jgi:SAM-dependent methyltransferase